ncbi:MAG: CoA pyrophosphatase [Oscillospiraceae bacterium]|nr:CoA pyrophosphatase [Oscillospiraceae bacterium]
MDWNAIKTALNNREIGPMGVHPPSAVVVPVIQYHGERCLLYEVRSASLKLQPGEVCFPGGQVEPGETALEAALREAKEELGIEIRPDEVLGPMDYMLHYTGFPVYPFLVKLDDDWPERIQINQDEVDEIFAIPISYLRYNPPLHSRIERSSRMLDPLPEQYRHMIEEYPKRIEQPMLFWPYKDKMLWGMSARITQWLLDFTREHQA